MTDLTAIREHMEVIGADGVHLGTVDKVEGHRIKMTRADSGSHGDHHHYISAALIAEVEGDKVRLSATVSFAASAAGMFAFTATESLPLALAACVVAGVAQGAIIPVLATLLLNGCPADWRGRSVGVFQGALYLSQFASPLAARWTSQALGGENALRLWAAAAALTATSIVLAALVRGLRPSPATP